FVPAQAGTQSSKKEAGSPLSRGRTVELAAPATFNNFYKCLEWALRDRAPGVRCLPPGARRGEACPVSADDGRPVPEVGPSGQAPLWAATVSDWSETCAALALRQRHSSGSKAGLRSSSGA